MNLVNIADEISDGTEYDLYELQPSEGEKPLRASIPYGEIMELPAFKDAIAPMAGRNITIRMSGTRTVLTIEDAAPNELAPTRSR